MAHCGVVSCSVTRYNTNHLKSAVFICDLILYSRNSFITTHTATWVACPLTHTHMHACMESSPLEGRVWHLNHSSCDRGLLWSWGGPFQHQTPTASRMLCPPEGSGWMQSVCVQVCVCASSWVCEADLGAYRGAARLAALIDNHGDNNW